jgi:UDP-N-acetylglucosamine 2-epimerase (non-hydrolysing)/GDP/UDP-N,N'-diacetylbacillosamine 2-epimerase (hydrolysing)
MKTVVVFTGTRAEYGLLTPILKGIKNSKHLELKLIVGGMHLSPKFGYTIDQIKKDGFQIDDEIDYLLSSDKPVAISKSMALATIGAAESFERIKPDILLLLGDRYEALAIAQAAMVSQTPIAHIHGGETTEGAIDEAIRHSITKMAHIHFCATDLYRGRILQLGENPAHVFNFGAPGLDSIINLPNISLNKLSKVYHFDFTKPYFLMTYHPVTLEKGSQAQKKLFKAFESFPQFNIIITYPNSDSNGRELIKEIEEYQSANSQRVFTVKSFGQVNFLNVMKNSALVIGNSSSGIIETPSFKTPTINIGNRQKGRISGTNTIHSSEDTSSIVQAIEIGLKKEFINKNCTGLNPYGKGDTSPKIIRLLETIDLENILFKRFFNYEKTYE